MVYTHVMQKDIRRIRSPLDNIKLKDGDLPNRDETR